MNDDSLARPEAAVIDHVVLNVRDTLDAAQAAYRRLGFTLTPRGHHTLGSINHLVVFGDSYFELLGFPPGAGHRRPELLAHPLGLAGLAFRSADALRQHAELSARRVPLSAPRHFSRPVTLADGDAAPGGEARFVTFEATLRPALPGRVFFCQQRTPELIWRPDWQHHANGVVALRELLVAADDPAGAAAAFAPLFPDRLQRNGGGWQLNAVNGTLRFNSRRDIERRSGLALSAHFPPSPSAAMAALVFQSTDLTTTAAALRRGKVPFSLGRDDSLVVAPDEGHGALLIFST